MRNLRNQLKVGAPADTQGPEEADWMRGLGKSIFSDGRTHFKMLRDEELS